MKNLYIIFPSIFFVFSYREDQIRLLPEKVLVTQAFIQNEEKLHAQNSWSDGRDQNRDLLLSKYNSDMRPCSATDHHIGSD